MTGRARLTAYAAVATMGSATALGAVFAGWGWLLPVAGGVAVVAVVAELVRRSPLPAFFGPILVAAAVTCYVTAVYAGATAYWHVVPSAPAFSALDRLARGGFSDSRVLATPVPTHRGLLLITVVGMAAVALLVDLFAVVMRRAALAGIPLLAVFALCTSLARHGTGWLPFAVAAAGFLALLLADSRERLARWGRSLAFDRAAPRISWSDADNLPSPLSVLGRRIGVTAIAIAAVVPILVPGLRGGVPHHGGQGSGPGASSSVVTINPIVTLRAQLNSARAVPVFRVRTSADDPPYLRLTSLDRFDGTTFWPSTLVAPAEAQVKRGITAPHPAGPTVRTTVSVANLSVRWLPLPVQVQSVDAPGDWRYDAGSNTVFSARRTTQGLKYSALSITPSPTAEALRQAGAPDLSVRRYLDLPPDLPADIRDLTDAVTAKATTAFDKALAIQNYLTSPPFVYDTHVAQPASLSALDDFLRVTHTGFCQQYATAMAVMARAEGLPSRVAVGFTRGEQQPDGTWLVTTHDAHAWPELYFSGFGWLPFEPTPRGDGQATPPAFTQNRPGAGSAQQPSSRSDTVRPKSSSALHRDRRFDAANAGDGRRGAAGAAHGRHYARTALLWALVALLICGLVGPWSVHALTRRRRWQQALSSADRADAAWAELRASAIDAGVEWVDGLTPQATARVLRAEAAGLRAEHGATLDRVVATIERAWYSAEPDGAAADGLRADVGRLRAALAAQLGMVGRVTMVVWPPSTLRAIAAALGRVGDLLNVLDVTGARLRARIATRQA